MNQQDDIQLLYEKIRFAIVHLDELKTLSETIYRTHQEIRARLHVDLIQDQTQRLEEVMFFYYAILGRLQEGWHLMEGETDGNQ